ncbi:acyl-homoserine lactone acylase PvdQ [Nocardiopsis mwathae]|uniref:Acyl-homoserine lactone acylase PvdQ n=1 Tax=Nocardiopsis mwathae TaxID=1472723 RepID=A0A7X0D7B9_9ACTN|nr:penicillin acylase family protein [Nocardiopsis mwathae]MBB6172864.1 acyl-homoserine lactone acylase PvdQ [Nocardiopsis mwathae]
MIIPHPRLLGAAAAGTALACLLTGMASAPAAAVERADAAAPDDAARLAAAVEDHCSGGICRDIVPPGQNGNATLVEIIGHQLFGTRPRHSSSQLDMYDNLLHDHDGLTDGDLGDYFADASFGVAGSRVDRRYRPRQDVTIVRDAAHGIPRIHGTTREGTMYGAGYAAAEDRLFLMDVLRNLGRGQLTPFAGGAPSNRALEQTLWRGAPYTEADKQAQIDRVAAGGERGRQGLADVEAYIEGINAYIDRSQRRLDYPGEYVLTGHKNAITQRGEIEHFTTTDVVGIAAMVGLLFGGGGGGEVRSALLKAAFENEYGAERGEELWRSWRMENDPEAVTTVDGDFPYSATPEAPVGVAMPDPGSVVPYDIVHDADIPAARAPAPPPPPAVAEAPTATDAATVDDLPESDRQRIEALIEQGDLSAAEGVFDAGVLPEDFLDGERGMSNALLVAGRHTESGNPVAVMGPQTGYFSPQLLMVQELQGPGISARGASFPGVSFYVQMGRGTDYAWSATSAGQDITDTFALELCEPDGSTPSLDSRAYVDDGRCVEFEELSVDNAWSPSVADRTPAGSYTLTALRSSHGLVDGFGTVDDTPVAFATRRSTYMREVDSLIGFQKFNEPGTITSATDFRQAAADIGYAFNWHYADADDIAFVNSGANPVRTPGTDPNLPIRADSEAGWSGWDPADNSADYLPPDRHPNALNPDYLVNWNNKIARGYTSGYGTGSVHRGDLLDARVAGLIDDGHKFTVASLTRVMTEAGVADLRAERVLPQLLRVIDTAPVEDPELAATVAGLRDWLEDGALRREPRRDAGHYAHADAIRVLDAWWPLLVRAQFQPELGSDLYTGLTGIVQVDESPSGSLGGEPGDVKQGQTHKGSSFQYGWWSYVDKDLRNVLGDDVRAPLGQAYCGGGDVGACRTALLDSLAQAAAAPASDVYPGDAHCSAGDQVCADAVIHSQLGGIGMWPIAWQNRPTYQLALQFTERRP